MVDLNEKRYISKQKTRNATGFKSLPTNRQEVNQVASKWQIDYLDKTFNKRSKTEKKNII